MITHKSHRTAPVNPFIIRVFAKRFAWIAVGLLLPSGLANAAEQLKEARVSEVVHDVKLLPQQAAARPASVSDEVKNGTAVRTGIDSRAELTFSDQTLARLGANTIFSFQEGTRNLQLGSGAMLLRVPKDAGGAQINTAAITAAITGTTIMLEYHPNAYSKFIVLEGTGRIYRGDHLGESVLVNAGQMMIVNPASRTLPNPVNVDIKRLMNSSSLVKKFRPLASNKLIDHEIGTQTKLKEQGGLIETNLVIFGSGTAVTLLDPTTTGLLAQANSNTLRQPTPPPTPPPTPTPSTPTPSPTPTPATPTPIPSKFGPPKTIASSTPYQINSGTTINTDPTITTNGRTNFGTIYRDSETDGALSKWLFGSTSEFDQTAGIDQITSANVGFDQIAAFKFSALTLSGTPNIIMNGGPTSLALISVGDITSGFPGGLLTFSGMNLLLATQNGSITLLPNVSFAGIPDLVIYARGAGSNLNLDSPIAGTLNLALIAEGNINVSDSLSIIEAGGLTVALSNALNIVLNAGQDINIGKDLSLTAQSGEITEGGNMIVNAGGNLTVGGITTLTLINSNGGDIGSGGTISINVPTGIFKATSDVAIRIDNEAGGTIGGSGGIVGNIGELSTASSFDSAIFNQGGTFNSNAGISFTFGTAAVTGEASFRILNEDADDGFGGGTITGDASVYVASMGTFSAGSLFAQIDNLGGNVSGVSAITFSSIGAFSTIHDATFEILVGAPEAGTTNAGINIHAFSMNIGGSLIAKITDLKTSFDFDSVIVGATNDITVGNQLLVDGSVTAGGDISVANGITVGGSLASTSGNITSTVGSITAQSLLGGTVSAGGDITINNSAGTATIGLMANSITALGNLFMINSPLITPNGGSTDGTIGETPFDFILNATQIVSTGPTFPALVSNGADAVANVSQSNPGNGGNVTLNLNGSLTIGSGSALTSITANGGLFASNSTAGGNGGTISILTTGDVTLQVDGNITATSGQLPTSAPATLGDGGTVNITTSGAITVNSKIEVSSDETTTPPTRRSAKGGNINLTSNKQTSGTAIAINNTGQLLALLDAAAPGPGGKITILASGNGGSSVNINGTVTASSGTIDIRHTGTNGTVNVSDAGGVNNALLHADVVKVGALGTNGVLTIGRGSLTANDTLKLYGSSSNGEVRFVDNVTIGGQNFTIIAANSVTINNGKIVTVTGAPADVYVGFNGSIPNANYRGFGGNNSTTGTFAGAGANIPQPIVNAPPFDGPPGG